MTDRTEQPVAPPDVTGTDMAEKPERFTNGLIYDVVKVLEAHGYQQPPVVDGDPTNRHRALGQTVSALLNLVRAFEGGDL